MQISSSEVLRVNELVVRRGPTVILDQISWSVRKGEHWAILGANGSGKTSLLKALTGYLMPSSGQIQVLGKQYGRADWRELRQRIGIVSSAVRQMMSETEPALASVVSGKYAMIDFWGRMTAADRRKALRILRQIECLHLRDRLWQVLSQGERQRVLIGRALMPAPPLLILDEPCAGLDPAAREHFLQFVERLARGARPPTLLLVTHHVEEITSAFSHVLILRDGQILAAGTTAKILTSARLAEAFKANVRLSRRAGRYKLNVQPSPHVII